MANLGCVSNLSDYVIVFVLYPEFIILMSQKG